MHVRPLIIVFCLTSCAVSMHAADDVAKRAAAQRRTVPPTPPMGRNAWNCFGGEVSEEKISAIADAMVSTGLQDAGYEYVVIDDGWHKGRVKGFQFAQQGEVPGRMLPAAPFTTTTCGRRTP